MNIIFLDFDGVLDTGFYDDYLVRNGIPEVDEDGRPKFDPVCVDNLKLIIDATGAGIVVTSSWKQFDSYQELTDMWNEREMPGTLIGVTPNLNIYGLTRGYEIAQWLWDNDIKSNYVIIDDLSTKNFFLKQLDKLVLVNPYVGLDATAAERAIFILRNQQI